MSIAAAVRSRPRLFMSSTAAIVNRSSSSSVTGESPAAAIPATASPAPSSVGKKASIVDRGGGAGRSLQRRLGDDRERPLAADEQVGQRVAGDVLDVLAAGPDDRAVGHHDLERQDRLAGLAVLHAAQAAGVRARGCRRSSTSRSAPDRAGRTGPRSATAALSVALMMPGWTTATRFSRSISTIRSIAVKAIVRPPSIPAAPPDRPVPAPRGTIGTPSSAASRTRLGDLGRRRSGGRRRPAGPACR